MSESGYLTVCADLQLCFTLMTEPAVVAAEPVMSFRSESHQIHVSFEYCEVFEVFAFRLSISISCYLIPPLQYISEANIVLLLHYIDLITSVTLQITCCIRAKEAHLN